MKAILYLILLFVMYQILKGLFRAGGTGSHREATRTPSVPGEEMVQDPQCRTYVVKSRSLERRIGGQTMYFCSAACADAHEQGNRPS